MLLEFAKVGPFARCMLCKGFCAFVVNVCGETWSLPVNHVTRSECYGLFLAAASSSFRACETGGGWV